MGLFKIISLFQRLLLTMSIFFVILIKRGEMIIMKNIGETLKKLRERNGLTRKEAVEKLVSLGIEISDKTLYGYESGRNSANADMFLGLCKIYNCNNIMEEFSETAEDVLFTNSEWKLLEGYRNLDDHGKKTVDITIARESQRISHIQELENKLMEAHMRLCLYPYMRKIACAGDGFYFDDIPTETIEAPYMEGTDFIIGVNGDSMEPDYFDGDDVYVKKTDHLKLGDVGIFTVGNECYIKEYGENKLISRNKKYDDITGTEDIRLIGKVIGKVEESE